MNLKNKQILGPPLWVLLISWVWLSYGQSVAQQMDRETAASRLCNITESVIQCPVIPVLDENLTVTGNVYFCNTPVYIQFLVKVHGTHRPTEYTFVNEDESQRVRNFRKYVTFRVMLRQSKGYVFVKAGFFADGYQRYILETHLDIPDTSICQGFDSAANRVLPIAIVTVSAIVLGTAASLLLVWWYKKRRKSRLTASQLLQDMEASPTSVPYQEEAITSELTGSKGGSTTVIQNTVYRDSLVLTDGNDALDTILEEGDGDTETNKGQRSRRHRQHKPNTNKPGRKPDKRANVSRNGYHGCRRSPDDKATDNNDSISSPGIHGNHGSNNGSVSPASPNSDPYGPCPDNTTAMLVPDVTRSRVIPQIVVSDTTATRPRDMAPIIT